MQLRKDEKRKGWNGGTMKSLPTLTLDLAMWLALANGGNCKHDASKDFKKCLHTGVCTLAVLGDPVVWPLLCKQAKTSPLWQGIHGQVISIAPAGSGPTTKHVSEAIPDQAFPAKPLADHRAQRSQPAWQLVSQYTKSWEMINLYDLFKPPSSGCFVTQKANTYNRLRKGD